MSDNDALRSKVHSVIFEAETPHGKLFDVLLLVCIVFSIISVSLETVPWIANMGGSAFAIIEWAMTLLFSVEYILRIYCVRNRWAYVFSFWGIVDLAAILPTYVSLFVSGSGPLLMIRGLRLLRVFRIFRLSRFISEAALLKEALQSSARKIIVFFAVVITIVMITGTVMFTIEGPENGFSSIPKSIYWSIVTLTTVGYGDITPKTTAGQVFSAALMILGYAILAVPTGIVSAELSAQNQPKNTETCPSCMMVGHPARSKFCYACGAHL